MAAYGNQASDGTAFTRPATVPSRSDSELVTTIEYNDNGEAFKTIDPAGKEDRTEFDDAGRRTKVIENYADGNPGTGSDDQDVTVAFTYTADGNLATIKAKISAENARLCYLALHQSNTMKLPRATWSPPYCT